jgi:hypothetical protein
MKWKHKIELIFLRNSKNINKKQMARPINIFRGLHIDEEEEPNKINIERKATKKLREIESLKKKDKNDLTDTEKEKISTENYWRDILNPPEKEEYKESLKEKEKRLKKEKERQKKEEEKKEKKKRKREKIKKKRKKKCKKFTKNRKKRTKGTNNGKKTMKNNKNSMKNIKNSMKNGKNGTNNVKKNKKMTMMKKLYYLKKLKPSIKKY